MADVHLIFASDQIPDVISVFENAFQQARLSVETTGIASTWMFDSAYVRRLRSIIRDTKRSSFTILHPPAELLLDDADLVVPFSAYRSWYDPQKMRVIPHLWTPIGFPQAPDQLAWSKKPPLTAGFMGRTFRSSMVCRLARSAPPAIKRWLMRGALVRNTAVAALLNEKAGFAAKGYNVFPRLEAVEALEKGELGRLGRVEIGDRDQFHGTASELEDYRQHLVRNTYILCPRGTENYSYRVYEALSYGRVPVIIDTDTVLPDTVDWRDVALIVPYGDVNRLNEIISEDHISRSEESFLQRQAHAFVATQSMRSLGWLEDIVTLVKQRLNRLTAPTIPG